jgi:hypothetical protein
VAQDFRARGGEVLGVSLDLDVRGATLAVVQSKLLAFLAEQGIDFPVLIYTGDSIELTERLKLQGGLPETLAFDASGARAGSHFGRASRAELTALAERALGR